MVNGEAYYIKQIKVHLEDDEVQAIVRHVPVN
jgi:hypothetical protein